MGITNGLGPLVSDLVAGAFARSRCIEMDQQEAVMSSHLPYEILPDLEHDSDAWHAARRASIGASEIAIVLGVSPWKSRLGLYLEKTSDEPPERDDSEFLRWGHLLEGAIIKEAAKRAEVEIASRGQSFRSLAHPWATGTPDAMTTDGEPVEAKNIAFGYDDHEWAEQIPEQYRLQCQHQMMVTGASRCLFAALLWGSRLIWEWVPRDAGTIRQIQVAGAEFMRRVRELDPPACDGHPKERAALAAQVHEDEAVELYEFDIGEHIGSYARLRALRLETEKKAKALKAEEDAAANAIAQAMGPAKRAFTASGWTFSWKTSERKGHTVQPSTIVTFQVKEPK